MNSEVIGKQKKLAKIFSVIGAILLIIGIVLCATATSEVKLGSTSVKSGTHELKFTADTSGYYQVSVDTNDDTGLLSVYNESGSQVSYQSEYSYLGYDVSRRYSFNKGQTYTIKVYSRNGCTLDINWLHS